MRDKICELGRRGHGYGWAVRPIVRNCVIAAARGSSVSDPAAELKKMGAFEDFYWAVHRVDVGRGTPKDALEVEELGELLGVEVVIKELEKPEMPAVEA